MALSVGEANAVCTLIRWLGNTMGPAMQPVTDERAQAALLLLREKAQKTLQAGPTKEDTHQAIERVILLRGEKQ